MRPRAVPIVLLAIVAITLATAAAATDQPITGASLVLKRANSGRELLTFASKDPLVPFPALGGSDDPTMAGVRIELFSPTAPTQLFDVASGSVGWIAKAGPPGSYKYRNALAGPAVPVASLQLKQAKQLKLTARAVGFSLVAPTGPIGIRITMGSLRSCALFTAATIQKDATNTYKASKASAAGLPNCSDAALGAYAPGFTNGAWASDQCGGECPAGAACTTRDLSSCFCVDGAQPCDGTWPVCNGECAVGEECLQIGGYPLPACGCLPVGSTACGASQCNGDCPAGQECNYFQVQFQTGCQCGAPGPCGGGGDDCPPGTHCVVGSAGTFCVP